MEACLRFPIPTEDLIHEQILRNNKDIPGMRKTIVSEKLQESWIVKFLRTIQWEGKWNFHV